MKRRDETCSCSRRSFLKGSGLTLAGFGVHSLFPGAFIRHAMGAPSSNRRLLFIFLRGGNDGLGAVLPHGDPQYLPGMRPDLYVAPPPVALDLNGFASLHPAMASMLDPGTPPTIPGDLAIIHRVGYPNSSQSHFDGQRIWENGDPTQAQLFDGWLSRYIADSALSAGVNLPALSVQPLPPVLLRGDEKFVNISDPNKFGYIVGDLNTRAKIAASWRQQHEGLTGLEPYRPILSQTGVKLVDTIDEYATWDIEDWDPKDPDAPANSLFPVDNDSNQVGFSTQAYPFFNSLKACALSLLESDGINNNGTRVAGTEVNGWDLHSEQVVTGSGGLAGAHVDLLSWIAYGFRSLKIVLSGAAIDPRSYPDIWADTVVATMSEFGRTTDQNGSRGTDHAVASCMFLQGGTVTGGVYNCSGPGDWPAGVMYGVDGRYLDVRTDFRSIFWPILRDHMGASGVSVDSIYPGYTSLGLGSQEILGLITP